MEGTCENDVSPQTGSNLPRDGNEDCCVDPPTTPSSASGSGKKGRKAATPRKRKSSSSATLVLQGEKEEFQTAATKVFKLQDDGSLLEVEPCEVASLPPPPPVKKTRKTPISKHLDVSGSNPSKKALANHVASFCNKYADNLVKKMEARQQAAQISLEELDGLIEEYGPEVKLSYTLPLMQWMRKTSFLIDSVAVMNKPMGSIPEAISFTQAALEAAVGEGPERLQAIRSRFEHKWWKIPSYDYETIRELTSQGGKARAILVGVTVSTFPDSESGEPVECLMPQFRYYPEIVTAASSSTAAATSPVRRQVHPRKKKVTQKDAKSEADQVSEELHIDESNAQNQ